jgi:hypothetical protein
VDVGALSHKPESACLLTVSQLKQWASATTRSTKVVFRIGVDSRATLEEVPGWGGLGLVGCPGAPHARPGVTQSRHGAPLAGQHRGTEYTREAEAEGEEELEGPRTPDPSVPHTTSTTATRVPGLASTAAADMEVQGPSDTVTWAVPSVPAKPSTATTLEPLGVCPTLSPQAEDHWVGWQATRTAVPGELRPAAVVCATGSKAEAASATW